MDILTFLDGGDSLRYSDLLRLHPVEAVPEANQVVHRGRYELVLLVYIQSHDVSLVGALALLEKEEVPAL